MKEIIITLKNKQILSIQNPMSCNISGNYLIIITKSTSVESDNNAWVLATHKVFDLATIDDFVVINNTNIYKNVD